MTPGTQVRTRHGITGRILRLYDDWSACAMCCVTMTPAQWLARQEPPYTDDELAEMWADIVVPATSHRIGGRAWAPLSTLVETA